MARIVCTSTDPDQHRNYERWLLRLASERGTPDAQDAGAVDFTYVINGEDIPEALTSADGLLLPGGGDPDPALYGRPDLLPFCTVDADRDRLEFAAIRWAVEHGMPVLGICRGLQVMNVALGGTLIADLPAAGYDAHHRITDKDRIHAVTIDGDSLLSRITGSPGGAVNSAHHQGVDLVAPRLRVTARSADGLPEALEWKSSAGNPFLLLLHWHPERLPGEHPLADSIGHAFLDAATQPRP